MLDGPVAVVGCPSWKFLCPSCKFLVNFFASVGPSTWVLVIEHTLEQIIEQVQVMPARTRIHRSAGFRFRSRWNRMAAVIDGDFVQSLIKWGQLHVVSRWVGNRLKCTTPVGAIVGVVSLSRKSANSYTACMFLARAWVSLQGPELPFEAGNQCVLIHWWKWLSGCRRGRRRC